MPQSDESPATKHDLRLLRVELADRSEQLGDRLALELKAASRSRSSERRADVAHLIELALGEIRVARRELLRRDQEAAEGARRVARMLRALLVLTIAETVFTVVHAVTTRLGG